MEMNEYTQHMLMTAIQEVTKKNIKLKKLK